MSSENARPLIEVALVFSAIILAQSIKLSGPLSIFITQIGLLAISLALIASGRLRLSTFRWPKAGQFPTILAYSAVTVLATQAAAYVILYFGKPPAEYLESLRPMSNTSLITYILLTWLLVAPAEESVFRGLIFAKLQGSMGFTPALLTSATLFSLAHLDMWRLLPTMAVGISTALAYWRTGTLISAIIVHGVNNTAALILSHLLD